MNENFDTLSQRAYELADTGSFSHWQEIGDAIESEGVERAAYRLGIDPLMRGMLNARCEQAKRRLS